MQICYAMSLNIGICLEIEKKKLGHYWHHTMNRYFKNILFIEKCFKNKYKGIYVHIILRTIHKYEVNITINP